MLAFHSSAANTAVASSSEQVQDFRISGLGFQLRRCKHFARGLKSGGEGGLPKLLVGWL